MVSDGSETALITIRIRSYAALNPFQFIEHDGIVSVSEPYKIDVSNWIVGTPLVYEDAAKTMVVPISIVDGKSIGIPSTWIAQRTPDYVLQPNSATKQTGFWYKEAYVVYTGCLTATVSVGKKDDDPSVPGYIPWWEDPARTEDLPENECNGDFYFSDGEKNDDRIIPIYKSDKTEIVGIDAIIYTTFKPDQGDSGKAYIYAEFDGAYDSCVIDVTSGGPGSSSNIAISADPDTISPIETSTITADVTGSDGSCIVGETIYFSLSSGTGRVSPGAVVLERTNGQVDEVMSSIDDSYDPPKHYFSLSKPVMAITSIDCLEPGFTWNGDYTIVDSTKIYLVDQEFPYDSSPLRVTYDWGGRGVTKYYPGTNTTYGQDNWIRGTVNGISNLCKVTIGDHGASDYTINLSAETPLRTGVDPGAEETGVGGKNGWVLATLTGPVARRSNFIPDSAGGHWDVEPTFFDPYAGYYSDGPINNANLSMEIVPSGRGSISSSYTKTKSITDEAAQINDVRQVSVAYPVHAVSSVVYNGDHYTVDRWEGNTIYIKDNAGLPDAGFGVTTGTATVSYTAGGIAELVYRSAEPDPPAYPGAPWGYNVTITAVYLGQIASTLVQVGDPLAATEVQLTATATPSEKNIPMYGEAWSVIEATYIADSGGGVMEPVEGSSITFTLIEGPGRLGSETSGQYGGNKKVIATTNASGIASTKYLIPYFANDGVAKIQVSDGDTQTTEVTVNVKYPTYVARPTIDVLVATISGTVKPDKTFTLTGGGGAHVTSWGLAEDADNYGGVTATASVATATGGFIIRGSQNRIAPWNIKDGKVEGGELIQENHFTIADCFYPTFDILVPWPFDVNTNVISKVKVAPAGLEGESTGAETTITIAGHTARLNSQGVAEFIELEEGEHPITITSPNYKDNREGATGGLGIYDSDTKNDTITIAGYSRRPFLLKDAIVNIRVYCTVSDTFTHYSSNSESENPWPPTE
jgi:hypothetical protein